MIKIRFDDKTEFSPYCDRISISRGVSANAVKWFSSDGEFVQKRRNDGRIITLEVVFDNDVKAVEFENKTKDLNRVYLRRSNRNEDLEVVIMGISWVENYVTDLNLVRFSLTLHERTIIENTVKTAIPTIIHFPARPKSWYDKYKAKFTQIMDGIQAAQRAVFGVLARSLRYSSAFMADINSISTQIQNLSRTGADFTKEAVDLYKRIVSLPNKYKKSIFENRYWSRAISRESAVVAVTYAEKALLLGLSGIEDEPELYYDMVSGIVGNLAGIAGGFAFENETVDDCVNYQDGLYDIYSDMNERILNDTTQTIDKTPDNEQQLSAVLISMLLSTIMHIEKNLLAARQRREISLDSEEDTFALVSRLYKTQNSTEFERQYNEFLTINNFAGDKMFSIPVNTPIIYHV